MRGTNSLNGPLDLSMYSRGDIRNGTSDFFLCGVPLHFGVPPGAPIIHRGAWGWPGTSLAITESICDISGRVATLFESIDTLGRQIAEVISGQISEVISQQISEVPLGKYPK